MLQCWVHGGYLLCLGIWTMDLKRRTNLQQPQVTKAIKTLEARNLIKAVKSVEVSWMKSFGSNSVVTLILLSFFILLPECWLFEWLVYDVCISAQKPQSLYALWVRAFKGCNWRCFLHGARIRCRVHQCSQTPMLAFYSKAGNSEWYIVSFHYINVRHFCKAFQRVLYLRHIGNWGNLAEY